MENLSSTARRINMVDDHSIKFKSLFIDMDLALHQSVNSPRVRRLQKSLDSHDEFEFSMSHVPMKDEALEHLAYMEVTSADRLFFKGQILPLQQDPKKPMACPKLEEGYGDNGSNSSSRHYRDYMSLRPANQKGSGESVAISENSVSRERAFEKGSFSLSGNEEISTLPLNYFPCTQGGSFPAPLKFANDERDSLEFSLREGIDLMRSCRMDGTFDLLRNDSCSSSFRSHHSNSYWSSGEKDSRDSIGSSRCSYGSYQDSSSTQGLEKMKAPHNCISMQPNATNHPSSNVVSSSLDHRGELNNIMGEFRLIANPIHGHSHAKPPTVPRSTSSRRWSWKGLFTGLRKASKLWVDDHERGGDFGRQSNTTSKEEIQDMQKKAVFAFKELPDVLAESTGGYRRSVGQDREWQANAYQFVNKEGSTTKKSAKGWGLGSVTARDDGEDQQGGAIYCLRSGGRQEAGLMSSVDGGGGENMALKREINKGKVQGNVWNAKESWNRCMDKVRKGTKLSVSACKLVQHKELDRNINNMGKNANMNMNEEDKMGIYRVMKAKSLSSTPLAKSPVRRAENGNAGSLGGLSLYSSSSMQQLGSQYYTGAGYLAAPAANSASILTSVKGGGNKRVGFAASCPASMRSSPHHSGLLAVVNKATPDLHTAIQGAIAHCKQSQQAAAAAAANPPP